MKRLAEEVDGAWLAALRFLFGGILCISMLRFLAYGWVERFFVTPQLHFKYYGFSWIEPLPRPAMHGLFWVLALLAACAAVGFLYRITASLFALGLAYVQLIDVSTYLNHYYLAAIVAALLAISPAGRGYGVDAWWRGRSATSPSGSFRVQRIWLYLFRFQVGLVYCFAGLAKLNSDWLVHAQPLRIWLGNNTDLPILGPLFTIEGAPLAMSWAGFLFDSTIVLWLSWRRTRPYAYIVVLTFHTMTRILFPIGMFPLIMSTAALVFFDPDWPLKVARFCRLPGRLLAPASAPEKRVLLNPWFVRAVAVFCALQILLPLRFLAYGGNVMWHEQGMRFSWRVMLRAKGGFAHFLIEEPHSGRRRIVEPRQYLTDLQEAEMVGQPDLILQFAHYLAQDFSKRGWRDVRVTVDGRVSLNGRRSRALVDPGVDLAREQPGLGRFSWVTDAPDVDPHRTRPVL